LRWIAFTPAERQLDLRNQSGTPGIDLHYLVFKLAVQNSRQTHQDDRGASRALHRAVAHGIAILAKVCGRQGDMLHIAVSHGFTPLFIILLWEGKSVRGAGHNRSYRFAIFLKVATCCGELLLGEFRARLVRPASARRALPTHYPLTV
jgi:hypothetical protein